MKTFDLEKEIGKSQVVIVDSALEFRNIVPWERAISLVVTDEANILIPRADGSLIRSAFLSLPRPLVVSLNRYVGSRVRSIGMEDPATRSMVFVRDNWTCAYCGSYGDTIDHIQPKSRGGMNTWGNLCVACHDCNEAKADSMPEEIGWKTPVVPRNLISRRKEEIQNAIYLRLEEMVFD